MTYYLSFAGFSYNHKNLIGGLAVKRGHGRISGI